MVSKAVTSILYQLPEYDVRNSFFASADLFNIVNRILDEHNVVSNSTSSASNIAEITPVGFYLLLRVKCFQQLKLVEVGCGVDDVNYVYAKSLGAFGIGHVTYPPSIGLSVFNGIMPAESSCDGDTFVLIRYLAYCIFSSIFVISRTDRPRETWMSSSWLVTNSSPKRKAGVEACDELSYATGTWTAMDCPGTCWGKA